MAPLDTGSVTHVLRLADPFGRGGGPSPSDFETLGDSFRGIREHKGLSLAQVADATRVRRLYLSALEQDDLEPLPSRPFAVGYVRAYARVLGLDGDAAVARFKAENPESASGALRAPMGVSSERDPRRRVLYAGLAVVVAAVGLWNVGQRTLTASQRSGPVLPAGAKALSGPPLKGPLQLGAPTPPPADQTTPQPYVTPGLGVPGVDPAATPSATDPAMSNATPGKPNATAVAPPAPSPSVFTTRAAVYGVAAQKGGVIIVQARKPASLIVRGPQGAIYFARQLQVGEAYRAPLGRGLTADVSDADAFDLYLNGKLLGGLSEPQTPLDKAPDMAATQPPPSPATAPPIHR